MENPLIYMMHDLFQNLSILNFQCDDKYFSFEMASKKMSPYPCVELQRPQVIELIDFLQKSLLKKDEK